MLKSLAFVLVALAASTALVPHASAALPDVGCPAGISCKPPQCLDGDAWTCGTGQCPVAPGTKVPNCSEAACADAGAALPAPYTGRSCQDTLCRSIPALYGTVVTTLPGVPDPLGLLPAQATTLVKHVLLRMAVVCEPGTGGGSGSGCQRVVYTPLVQVGANAIFIPSPTAGTATLFECAWVSTSMGGPMSVSEWDGASASAVPACANTLVVRPTFGSDAATWVFTNGC